MNKLRWSPWVASFLKTCPRLPVVHRLSAARTAQTLTDDEAQQRRLPAQSCRRRCCSSALRSHPAAALRSSSGVRSGSDGVAERESGKAGLHTAVTGECWSRDPWKENIQRPGRGRSLVLRRSSRTVRKVLQGASDNGSC